MDKVKSFFVDKILPLLKKFAGTSFAKALLIWVVLMIVLAFAVDKVLMPAFAGAFTSTGEVPNLEGMNQETAEKTLSDAGFKFEWLEEGRYSTNIDSGKVLVQMPTAGRTAKLGRTVKLTRSLGLRQVEIPDLRGKSQKQATISLTRAGLVQGAIVKGAHQSIPRGVVIRTIPEAGQLVRVGDTIKVVISAGETKGKVLLPNFEGEPIDDVYAKVEALGLQVGKVKRQKDDEGRKPGSVISTSPKFGDYLPPNTKINFVIVD
ncbi:MAG: PASTA domain-containing protein [Fibrobacter sp.]|nr:PASTA domain-containing protein [Fibrobacter sp.]